MLFCTWRGECKLAALYVYIIPDLKGMNHNKNTSIGKSQNLYVLTNTFTPNAVSYTKLIALQMLKCTGRVGRSLGTLVAGWGSLTLGGRVGLTHTWWQGGAHSH